jgi:hypothetical protein
LQGIRTGGKGIREKVERIRADLDQHGDKKVVAELKKQLPGVLWSGTFTQRANDKQETHSGLICADLDSLNGDLREVSEKLRQSPYSYAVFISPSGEGLKVVFRVPADATKHGDSFRAVEQYVRDLTGKQIDQACKDPARLCFLSYDPDPYHNANAQELTPLPEPERPKFNGGAMVNLSERQRIASDLLGEINWQSEVMGFCRCPAEHLHTNADNPRNCRVALDGSPTVFCVHNSCRGIIDAVNHELRSRIGKGEKANESKNGKGSNSAMEPPANGKRKYQLIDLSAIIEKPVEWIEESFLARGEMHFLQGQGGSYKGTMALTWVAEATQRGEHALLILAEDDLAKKVKPSLLAAGANMSLVHPMLMRNGEDESALVLPCDTDQLEEAIKNTSASVVVIDPLLSHVAGNLDSYRDHDMKLVLTQIGKMAQRTNATVICVHHTKKDTSGGMKLAGQGSTAFYTTARIVLAMAKISEEEAVLEVVKSNIGPEGARQSIKADLVELGKGIKSPRLTRNGEAPISVAEVLAGQHKDDMSKSQKAAILILDILEQEGEQEQRKLFDRVANETGLKPGTVRRKVYWDILQDEDLVDSQKDDLTGIWLIRRNDRERPKHLRGSHHQYGEKQKTEDTEPEVEIE